MALDLKHPDVFVRRHIGPSPADVERMLRELGVSSLDALMAETVPESIRLGRALDIGPGKSESDLLALARALGQKNQVFRSYIGMGYSGCITPPVILRNVIQSPGWYTPYTPYQAEVAQGRLEALLNYQTMIMDLTAFDIANASLLDEATAAAEAMHLAYEFRGGPDANAFFVSDACHPQTIDVVRTRAEASGIELVVGDHRSLDLSAPGSKSKIFGVLVQYPTSEGSIDDYRDLCERVHAAGGLFIMAADILSLALLTPPGELGADVAVGSSQRFGVPLGYGGPYAAYFATKNEFVRKLPGRIIGVSKDTHGNPALRLSLQTREQHIRREKATSNICTAQALLAVVASMFAAYHGPQGIRGIAERVHNMTSVLAAGLKKLGVELGAETWFDTIAVKGSEDAVKGWLAAAEAKRINLRKISATKLGISLDETTQPGDVADLLAVFGGSSLRVDDIAKDASQALPEALRRTTPYLLHPVWNSHHSETEMLRYLRMLEDRDISLANSMIPLGSCTMKLNATAEMMPITEPDWNAIHPFVPLSQAAGYQEIIKQLEGSLAEMTGFARISLQPNAGSQGEYAGLLVIRKYHESRGEGQRNICLIPSSAHGTNPASAVMAGLEVVIVKCDDKGNIDLADLEAKANQYKDRLNVFMVTYPSTHGVFEEEIKRICEIVHANGGQVYMDGANLNAQLGLCRPGDMGADVCHLNLHKTFCIPHGGGGPGMGPIGVAAHLAKFLPRHPVVEVGEPEGIGAISAAPWGSASILLISWAYIQMMGGEGLTQATKVAILNANYVAERLRDHYQVVYRGKRGRVAHECILDMRPFKKSAGIEVDDIAKRLMDFGFHAPTMSFPIPGTLMVEPTESEPLLELDRFIEAMIAIREEIRAVEEGRMARDDNPLKNAPHTAAAVLATEWKHPYPREQAAFPAPWTKQRKYWPPVGRVNSAYGDRNLVCSCLPIEEYAAPA
ncbi:MAG: aminomethyl-transferring glycine dehydrogenase [Polyangiaceae bacterium]|nr:aminomethyl-transferring glycine dehydrogenase [Polyangiaceae bacterium]